MSVQLSDQQQCYEAIASHLAQAVPEAWEKIQVDFTLIKIDEACEYSITYVPRARSSAIEEFFLDDTDFVFAFYSLARATSTQEKSFYKSCKFEVFVNGRYKCSFEYEQRPSAFE